MRLLYQLCRASPTFIPPRLGLGRFLRWGINRGKLTQLKGNMRHDLQSRRQFLEHAAAAGALLLAPGRLLAEAIPSKRTAVDQVTLGKTGLKFSRLGFGTGSNSGTRPRPPWAGGIQPASSITPMTRASRYFDCAEAYPPSVDGRRHQGSPAREALPPVQDRRQTGRHSRRH